MFRKIVIIGFMVSTFTQLLAMEEDSSKTDDIAFKMANSAAQALVCGMKKYLNDFSISQQQEVGINTFVDYFIQNDLEDNNDRTFEGKKRRREALKNKSIHESKDMIRAVRAELKNYFCSRKFMQGIAEGVGRNMEEEKKELDSNATILLTFANEHSLRLKCETVPNRAPVKLKVSENNKKRKNRVVHSKKQPWIKKRKKTVVDKKMVKDEDIKKFDLKSIYDDNKKIQCPFNGCREQNKKKSFRGNYKNLDSLISHMGTKHSTALKENGIGASGLVNKLAEL
jgi:hypothetical protein